MNTKSKTLIILSPGFASAESDTTCLPWQQQLVLAFNRIYPELKVIIISLHYPYRQEHYQWHGNTVIPFGGRNARKLRKWFLWWRVWKALKKMRTGENIIGILSFWCTETAFIANRFGKRHSIKHICWISGQDAKKDNGFVKIIRPAAKELAAMSDFLADEFSKNHGIRPGHVIPNAINPAMFGGPVTRDIDIMGAGSLIELKQFELFIEVVKDISMQIPGIRAVICGEGEERKKLEKKIEELEMQDKIILAGEISHSEVLNRMQRARVFLHCSRYEGFGTVYLEALAAGCHVIGFTRAMKIDIPHWHIINGREAMTAKALEILSGKQADDRSVQPYKIDDSARMFMEAFGYPDQHSVS